MECPDQGDCVRFECFEVDRRAHLLRRDGQRVALQEQPFQVLLALLEVPGEVVTRDTLRRRLWGEDTFVDFNQSMNSAVRRLRHALGDDPEYPKYIETIPRVGYRFAAEVAIPGRRRAHLPGGTVPPEQEGSARDRPWSWVYRWSDPVAVVWLLVLLAGSTILPWELHQNRQVRASGAEPPAALTAAPAPAAVAVLPLRNLTGRARDQYVIDGFTDAVTTKLAERPGLRVMSQFPADQSAHKDQTLIEFAREMNVQSVVAGAVRRQGDRVWITTQLLDATHGTCLWANTYTEETNDLAKTEMSIAEEVASQVDQHLTTKSGWQGKTR